MSLLFLVFFGAIVGWLSTRLLGASRQGFLGNIILGILGSMIGGWIMNYFGKPGVYGFNLYSIMVGVIGAGALIVIFRILGGSSK